MTEEEAKTRWCPFVRFTHPNARDFTERWNNRDSTTCNNEYQARCIGSVCMAWRWGDSKAGYGEPGSTHGFCGLAGKP